MEYRMILNLLKYPNRKIGSIRNTGPNLFKTIKETNYTKS